MVKWWSGDRENIGKLQLEYLKDNGLKPHMKFLDIGCGDFRTGEQVVKYIGEENYYAIDSKNYYYKAKKLGVTFKRTKIFTLFDEKFDMIWAWSMFTHLDEDAIELCIKNVAEVMHDESIFIASFFAGDYQRWGKRMRNFSYP